MPDPTLFDELAPPPRRARVEFLGQMLATWAAVDRRGADAKATKDERAAGRAAAETALRELASVLRAV